jgi:HPt (histidine-containing phosphotransfer) domain-containing protein
MSNLYDLSQLIDMYSGNMANVKMTTAVFCDQMSEDMDMIQQKLDEGDLLSVKALAHRMKPNMKLFGVNNLHELIITIEASCLANQVEKLTGEVKELREKAAVVIDAMKKD